MNLTNEMVKNLKDKKYRKSFGLFLVEGEKFCRDLLDSDIEIIHTITTNEGLIGFPNILIASNKQLLSLASTVTPQNIICVCKVKSYPIESRGNSIILDNLQDPGNVGTLVRSAVAFGFEDIYLVGGADPYSEKVIRSSVGTILKARLHIVDFSLISENKSKVAENFIVADMNGESIDKIYLPKNRIAVIIGNEGQGVSREFMSLADTKIAIPMSDKVESLNAGVAGSIIMQRLGEV